MRHIGETAGKGVATAATAVAAGVTFGQVDALNEAVATCAKSTVESLEAAAKATASNVNETSLYNLEQYSNVCTPYR